MNKSHDIKPFLDDPSLLVDLCRAVIQQLRGPGISEAKRRDKDAQLRAVAKAIEQLKGQHVPIPDTLLAEKTRLAAELASDEDRIEILRLLISEFEDLTNSMRTGLGLSDSPVPPGPRPKPTPPGELTPPSVLEPCLLETMRELGGTARCNDILDRMEKKLRDRLLPGDLEPDTHHGVKWRHQVHWLRLRMKHEGTFRRHSPRGIWELSEEFQ